MLGNDATVDNKNSIPIIFETMITFETALNFFIINVSLCLIPCAEMVIVITQSTMRGWKSGMAFVAGLCFALTIQVVLMAFGVSAIVQASAFVFNALKIVGVCYLFFLAWQAFTQPITLTTESIPDVTHWKALFRKGIILNFSTPMTPLYLLFLIPPFVDAERGSIIFQSLQLGFLIIFAFFFMYALYSVTAEKIGEKILKSEKVRRYLQRSAALTIAGFAIYLALAQQSS